MLRIIVLTGLMLAGSSQAATTVSIVHGNVLCHGDKVRRVLTTDGKNGEVTLSPDGHTVAFIHQELSQDTPDGQAGALWTGDCRSGAVHHLLPSIFNGRGDGEMWLSLDNPAFSSDGRYIYVSGFFGGDGGLIQRVETATGKHKYAFPGEMVGVLRSGPYQGDILATEHTCAEAGGCNYPLYVLRPDGHAVMKIDGSESWDEKRMRAWLKAKGWRLS